MQAETNSPWRTCGAMLLLPWPQLVFQLTGMTAGRWRPARRSSHLLEVVVGRVQLRPGGRQMQKADVGRDVQFARSVPACLVESEHGVCASRDAPTDLVQVMLQPTSPCKLSPTSRVSTLLVLSPGYEILQVWSGTCPAQTPCWNLAQEPSTGTRPGKPGKPSDHSHLRPARSESIGDKDGKATLNGGRR